MNRQSLLRGRSFLSGWPGRKALRRVVVCLVGCCVLSLTGAVQAQALAEEPVTQASGKTRADRIRAALLNPADPAVLVVAHRGHHLVVPENSIASIQASIDEGAHIVEIDVGRAADGTYILMHDKTIARTTFRKEAIDELTGEELQQIPLRHGIRPSTETIPTLQQAFDAARDQIMLNLDPKSMSIREAAELARTAGVLDHCIFKAFWDRLDEETLAWLRANPDVFFMPIVSTGEDLQAAFARDKWPAVELLIETPDDPYWSRDAVERFQNEGISVWINTLWGGRISAGYGDRQAINDPEGVFGPVLDLGFNIVQTDLIELLMPIVRDRGLDPTAPTEYTRVTDHP